MAYNYTYNLTFENGVNNTADWLTGINTASNGLPAIGILFIIWFSAFFLSKITGGDMLQSWIIASFSTTIFGALMFFMGWIGWSILIIPLILTIFGIIVINFR